MKLSKVRSRSLRKTFARTPGGRTEIHRKRRNPSAAKCANCKKQLHGIPRLVSSKFRNLSKSEKRPERPFGGYLCSGCLRNEIKGSLIK